MFVCQLILICYIGDFIWKHTVLKWLDGGFKKNPKNQKKYAPLTEEEIRGLDHLSEVDED